MWSVWCRVCRLRHPTFTSTYWQVYPSDPLRKISALQTKLELAGNPSNKQNLAENLAYRELASEKKFFGVRIAYIVVLQISSGGALHSGCDHCVTLWNNWRVQLDTRCLTFCMKTCVSYLLKFYLSANNRALFYCQRNFPWRSVFQRSVVCLTTVDAVAENHRLFCFHVLPVDSTGNDVFLVRAVIVTTRIS